MYIFLYTNKQSLWSFLHGKFVVFKIIKFNKKVNIDIYILTDIKKIKNQR